MHDVVVIGAGPTGCYAARELARLGYEVLVLEEHTEVGEPVHCTGVIGIEAYKRFDLDVTCIEEWLSQARFISPSGRSFHVASETARAVVVDRRRFDQALAREAFSAGASFILGTRAEQITIQDDRVEVVAKCFGERYAFRTVLVIIATGAEVGLARQLGLAHESARPLIGGQLFMENRTVDEVEIHINPGLAPDGFAWAVPVKDNGCRVGMVTSKYAQKRLNFFADKLQARGAVVRNGMEINCRQVPAKARIPSYGERVIVIGDAAGQVKSTTSGGIVYGLLGAETAVQVAHESFCRGDLSSNQLSRYQQLWLGRIGYEQRLGRIMRKLYSTLGDREIDGIFSLVKKTGLAKALSQMRFDWHGAGALTILWRALLEAGAVGKSKLPTPI